MVGICPSPNLYEVLVTCYCIEGKLGLPAAEIVVTSDQAACMWVAAAAVIDSKFGIVFTTTETDGNLTCFRSCIAVPDVWSSYTMAWAVELCIIGVERQISYIANGYCVNAVIIKQSSRRDSIAAYA